MESLQDATTPGEQESSPHRQTERSSTFSRVISGLSLSRGSNSTAEEIKGPLGLTLLFASEDPMIYLVFIHGLNGGSRKTWSQNADAGSFWPKEWLSRDPDFRNVRIHSFGYDSEWSSRRESVLNVSGFGRELLAALQTSPFIRRSARAWLPIVFVGHSMGGIVMKKLGFSIIDLVPVSGHVLINGQAYLLAQPDPAYQDLGQRIHAMFFLATPHHGASSAELLSLILSASRSGNRPFVRDIHSDSRTIQDINDEFRHQAAKLLLYSFWENRPVSFAGFRDVIIVKKTSAVMGLPNERKAYIDANHRGVCKFESPDDSNYKIVKDHFVEVIDGIRTSQKMANKEVSRARKTRLRDYLYMKDVFQEEYMELESPKTEGSCEWLIKKDVFRAWRETSSTQFFLLYGNPATGKTFLTSYVLDTLRSSGHRCSFFRFQDGNDNKSSLNKCLLSIAYQMAISNPEIQHLFLAMENDGIQYNPQDFRSIWRQLFLNGIQRLDFFKRPFWIIDALDECRDVGIFISSRPDLELQSQLQRSTRQPKIHKMSPEDTIADIKIYVESDTNFPLMQDAMTRSKLVETIVSKSKGYFLWVKLVLVELRKVYSVRETEKILDSVPTGMDKLFMRNLNEMATASYGKSLTKAILIWAVCSIRPLTIQELEAALEYHVKDTVYNLEHQIAISCGNLVYVDSQSQVQVIHQTARKFLLSPHTKSEFAFSIKKGHGELAMTCLRYLNSDEMRSPRTRRPSAIHQVVTRSPFLEYAAKAFYDHINRASSADRDILGQVHQFLTDPQGNVLAWVEHIAKAADLSYLIKCGFTLKNYLKRRAKYSPLLGKEIQFIDSWSTDFIRIVAKFGHNLVSFPISIYYLIPPFCPPESAPYRLFGKSARGISVFGLSSLTWDDRLACVAYRISQTTSVSCNISSFAVGASDKSITLYRTSTCQVFGRVVHGEYVRSLAFSASERLMASAGRRFVHIWDVNLLNSIWHIETLSPCVAMAFTSDSQTLLIICNDSRLYSYNIASLRRERNQQLYTDYDHTRRVAQAPDTAAFSLEHGLLAFVYRGGHINIWDWRNSEFVGTCEKPLAQQQRHPFHASALVFNPSLKTSLLAASYEAGEIIVFDPHEGEVKCSFSADTDTQNIACSPDGRTLISGDSFGTLRIFEFHSLKLLYVIHSRDTSIGSVSFCGDNMRFVDIRGTEINIWEPAILARQAPDEDASDTSSLEVKELSLPERTEIDEITSMTVDAERWYIFYGTNNGCVKGQGSDLSQPATLFASHAQVIAITRMVFHEQRELLACADSSSRTVVQRPIRAGSIWKQGFIVLDHRMDEAVEQLLFNKAGTHLLIVTTTTDTVCSLLTGEKMSVTWTTRNPGIWANHPHNHDYIILTVKERLRIYRWNDLKLLTPPLGVTLEIDLAPELGLRYVHAAWNGNVLITEYSEVKRSRSKGHMILWDTAAVQPSADTLPPHPVLQRFGEVLASLMGSFGAFISVRGHNILFLDHSGWICSVEMGEEIPTQYKRHFFLPWDWLTANHHLLFEVTANGDIIFAKGGELAVIKKGLESVEWTAFEIPNRH